MKKRTTAITALGTLAATAIAVPAVALTAGTAFAVPDIERHGQCGTGDYEFGVDHEDGGFEVESQLEHLPAGQKWRITLKHDGKTYYSRVRSADVEGDIDVDSYRSDTAGKDVFTYTAKRIGGTSCTAQVTLR